VKDDDLTGAACLGGAQPTESLPLSHRLSLTSCLKLLVTFFHADLTVHPLDEWELKSTLLAFHHDPPLSLLMVLHSNLFMCRLPHLQKCRCEEPVTTGVL
jgi:splicing factor, arginine/serine-rich 17